MLRAVPLMPSRNVWLYFEWPRHAGKGGACYVAAFDNPANMSGAHIVAYIDWFVRRFLAEEPLVQEPLRDPDIVVYTCGNNTESMDVGNENNMVLGTVTTMPRPQRVWMCFCVTGRVRPSQKPGSRNVDNTRKAEFSYAQ